MDAGSRGEEVARRLEAEGGSEVESEAENEAQDKGKAEGASKTQGKDRKEESFRRKNGAAGREEESREEARGNEGSEEAINKEGGEAASLSTRCLRNKAAEFGGLLRSPSRRVAESLPFGLAVTGSFMRVRGRHYGRAHRNGFDRAYVDVHSRPHEFIE